MVRLVDPFRVASLYSRYSILTGLYRDSVIRKCGSLRNSNVLQSKTRHLEYMLEYSAPFVVAAIYSSSYYERMHLYSEQKPSVAEESGGREVREGRREEKRWRERGLY